MWHTESDLSGFGAASGLTIRRTYNSGPYNVDAMLVRQFGRRWSNSYDAVLTPQAASTSAPALTCWRREDTRYVWCESAALSTITGIPPAVSITRGDGKKYFFNRSGARWVGSAGTNDQVGASYSADGATILGWTYTSGDGDVIEQYDANGALMSIASRSGVMQRLTYSKGVTNDARAGRAPGDAPACSHIQDGPVLPSGLLLCVTDNWGRQLQFEYDAKGRAIKVIDPLNQETMYDYDGPSGGCPAPGDVKNLACSANNLTKVTFPDGKSKTYFYNEAARINGGACPNVAVGNGFGHLLNALTGLVDENGARHISWTYDCNGMATSSLVGDDTEKVELTYGVADTNGLSTTTVTHYIGTAANPLTTVRQYGYQTLLGVVKNTGVDLPCVECGPLAARTYDANGNLATGTDWKGNKTMYAYDLTHNLETSRTEASGTPQARTISTLWHPTYRLPAKIAEPLRITTLDYDTAGNLLKRTERATLDATGARGLSAAVVGAARVSNYTYNAVGQVTTMTGPRTDVLDLTKYDYDAQGNLSAVTNALRQVTTLSDYDGNGRVGHVAAPNGVTTDLTYWPRGWLKKRFVNAGGVNETTSYEYDGVGQLKTVTLPDRSSMRFDYDDAHRLVAVTDSLGNKVGYTLDRIGNRVLDQVTDPANVLTGKITRVYDALNLLKQQTGGTQ